MTKGMIAAVYIRVSTTEQNTANQLPDLEKLCLEHDWPIKYRFKDTVTASGKTPKHDFDRMMLLASERKFNVLVVWALDRMTREGTLIQLQILKTLISYGVVCVSFSDPWLNDINPYMDVMIAARSCQAKEERALISRRTKAALDRIKIEGSKSGRPIGHPPLDIDMALLVELRDSGATYQEIADETGIKFSTVYKRLKGVAA